MLQAQRAVADRNKTSEGTLAYSGSFSETTRTIDTPEPGDMIVFTCVWHRAMIDEDTPITGSPGNINLFLERRPVEGGSWTQVTSSESEVDNLEQVRDQQPSSGQQYDFRIKIKRVNGNSQLIAQPFTVSSRHSFD